MAPHITPTVEIDGRTIYRMAGGGPSIEELRARQTELRQRLAEIDTEYAGEALPDATRSEWEQGNAEIERNAALIEELEIRAARVAELNGSGEADPAGRGPGQAERAAFQTARPGATRGDDIYDLTTVRRMAATPEAEAAELRSRVLRSVESSVFPDQGPSQDAIRSHIERLLARFEGSDDSTSTGEFARRVLVTGSPTYKRAFGKVLTGQNLSPDETRSLSLSPAGGGYAVPYTLDPTIIPISNGSVNPFRQIARIETITGDEWRGVTAGAITAGYVAEGTEATDDAPTIAQPVINVSRAQAFIPYSIEIGQDWGAMQNEMAMLLAEAKDDLEAVKFLTGGGTDEPFGVLTGATTTVTAGGTASFDSGDLDAVEAALPARFRARAQWVANRAIYQNVRHFDTQGGADLWVRINEGLSDSGSPRIRGELLGYPAWEASAMAAALTTGNKIAVLGDWRYFIIVDRVGLNIEVIPHLFGTARNFPTGQRGLYAFWRNGSKVVSANAFRTLVTG